MSAPTGLLFVDSFDHYNTLSQMQRKWTALGTGGAFATGRSGSGQCYQCTATGSPELTLGYEYATLASGFAYQTTAFANDLVNFRNIRQGFNGFSLSHVGDGRLFVQFPFTGVQSIISGFTMSLNTWYYVELQCALNFTGSQIQGNYIVRINNVVIASGTLSFNFGSALNFAQLVWGAPGGANNCSFDDLYITDGELLGDYNWICIYPNAVGDSAQWMPSPSQANYLNVQEHAPDDFSTYNEAGAIGNQDLYNLDNVGSVTIIGIHALNCATKIAAGVASMESSIKTNTTLVQEPEFFPSFGSWLYQRQAYRKNPVTGLDWTAADINAIQRGALRIS